MNPLPAPENLVETPVEQTAAEDVDPQMQVNPEGTKLGIHAWCEALTQKLKMMSVGWVGHIQVVILHFGISSAHLTWLSGPRIHITAPFEMLVRLRMFREKLSR